MGFIRFRAVCTVALCLLLLALFWVPQRMLAVCSEEWNAEMDRAIESLKSGDLPTAQKRCAALTESYRQKKASLERFLNHDAVESVMSAFGEAEVLAGAEDTAGALAALARARGGIGHLLCIERFTWNALL